MRLFKDANFSFLTFRRRAYVISAALLVVGLGSIAVRGGLNAGVEFTGGTLVHVGLSEASSVAELRDLVNAAGVTGAQIQPLRSSGGEATQEYLFRVRSVDDDAGLGDVGVQVQAALEQRFGEEGVELLRREGIGPQVGDELRSKAVLALLLSFLLTLIYLAFRFEWRFGFAAVIATIHDIAIAFGFISLFDIEMSLATVAAILTIVGYSLNDTIVVFDRVRENLKKKRKESYEDTLDRSINETLPRTVLTSSTTLVALVALFAIGGTVIRPFALVLILGIVIGTYSSIFVASPALLEIHHWQRRRHGGPAHATG